MRGLDAVRAALCATVAVVSTALPSAAWAQTQGQRRTFNVPSQQAATGVAELARQADAQILISAEDAVGKTTRNVVGNFTTEQALALLLEGTGLSSQRSSSGTFVVAAGPPGTAEQEAEGVPEVLVIGRRNWSLNTGIQRTRDDAQPFVVFDQEQIRRTGATNLEGFLSNYLPSNAQAGSSEDAAVSGTLLGRSQVDLRGLGVRETLILIDGRRQPGLNNGSGNLEQPVITNIPLASIERVEVLSSSASGIYGVGATGGVINVILRRDYSGGELTFNYADTTDLKAPDRRVDLVLGTNIEGGRTNLSFSGSYRASDPLTRGERRDFVVGASRFALANNLDFFGSPPLGSTPNIRSFNRANLTLDPIYGGGSLGTNRTFIPVGYRGVAADGVAPLVANAGQYNLDLADIAGSGRAPLVYGTDLLSGTLAVRREMNSWLRMYVEAAGSVSKVRTLGNTAPDLALLGANNPANPFRQAIVVTVPQFGFDDERVAKTSQLRLVGGAIAKLGGDWQAALDVAYSPEWFDAGEFPASVNQDDRDAFEAGAFDVLRDTALQPFVFARARSQVPSQDLKSSLLDTQLKIAGPLPFSLPGGRPVVSLNLQRSHQDYGRNFEITDFGSFASIEYTPPRSETIYSAYGEVRVPLVGEASNIPLVRRFEITAAARYERYEGIGANTGIPCFESFDGFPAGTIDLSACDPDAIDFPVEELANSHVDPSVAVRWQVVPDLTFRASYATGYLPPRLADLIREADDSVPVQARDPERGGEPVGTIEIGNEGFIPGFIGGNADVDNEESTSLTAGAILTPRFIPGLRLSIDYTRIRKKNNFANPSTLLFSGTNFEREEAFQAFLRLYPERITRGPPSDGFAVGPITSIDASLVNIAGTTVEAIDFAFDYGLQLGGGTLDFSAAATHTLETSSQTFPDSEKVDFTGVIPIFGSRQLFANGALEWRGNGSIRWSNERFEIGWRGRYFDGFLLNVEGTVVQNQGSARVRSQFYQDLFGSYRFDEGFTIRAGVNNIFNRRPPYVANSYSTFGDPRLANFFVNLSKAF